MPLRLKAKQSDSNHTWRGTLEKFGRSRRDVFAVKQPVMVNEEQEGSEKWKNDGTINPRKPSARPMRYKPISPSNHPALISPSSPLPLHHPTGLPRLVPDKYIDNEMEGEPALAEQASNTRSWFPLRCVCKD
jgi:hypothetical protein